MQLFEPELLEKVPGEHIVHAWEPSDDAKVPEGQSEHSAAPSDAYEPTGHREQLTVENCPAGQLLSLGQSASLQG